MPRKMTKSEERAYNRGKAREKARQDVRRAKRKVKKIWVSAVSIFSALTIYIFIRALNIKTGDFFINNATALFWVSGIMASILVIAGVVSFKKIWKKAGVD